MRDGQEAGLDFKRLLIPMLSLQISHLLFPSVGAVDMSGSLVKPGPDGNMGTLTEKHDGSHPGSDDLVDVEQVDRVAAPPPTLESFAHLDEKAILRKVCSPSALSATAP
jgi:hypothetical protein